MIAIQFALRRRMMGGGKKKWTIEMQDTSAQGHNASAIYPLINGEKRGTGVYEVNDGDMITLYAKGNGFADAFAVIQVNGTKVASATLSNITSYDYKVNSNCNIQVNYQTTGAAVYSRTMNTFLTTK